MTSLSRCATYAAASLPSTVTTGRVTKRPLLDRVPQESASGMARTRAKGPYDRVVRPGSTSATGSTGWSEEMTNSPRATRTMPPTVVARTGSPRTVIPRMAAVNGSDRDRVAAAAIGVPDKPKANSTYDRAVVTTNQAATRAPLPERIHTGCDTTNQGASTIAEALNTTATTKIGGNSANSAFAATRYTAQANPAPRANTSPPPSMPAAAPPEAISTAPPTERIVAIAHRPPTLSPLTAHPSSPARIGPLPMVTIVPTATPVFATPVKNNGCDEAIAAIAASNAGPNSDRTETVARRKKA